VTPLVLKIGGSLAETGRLGAVLATVVRSRRRIVIVPGGGAYADAVRAAQAKEGYSDAEAHRRAILAMHRMARDMADMQPRFSAVATLENVRGCWRRGAIPVWLPLRLAERDTSLPQDWSVTSDGLAARLSERLGGLPVALLKPCRVRRSATAHTLAAAGIVDPTFAAIVRRSGLDWRILGPREERELRGLIGA
jgi:aspartokinase-like uncharacterized kinase